VSAIARSSSSAASPLEQATSSCVFSNSQTNRSAMRASPFRELVLPDGSSAG
jgi:hypothetical protein